MSRKDHAKRVQRERAKKEQRKLEEERKRKASEFSPKKVMADLRALFKEDSARAMTLLFDEGLSPEAISERVGVSVEEVRDLRDRLKHLPPTLKRLLQSHPEVLSNPAVLEAAFEGAHRSL